MVGGHLAPALAVIEALPQESELLFIGRKHALEGDKAISLEYQKVTAMGIAFHSLQTGRLQRKISRHSVSSLIKLPYGFWQAGRMLRKFNPDVVIGFGGYLQIPVAFAASSLRIPIVIHEQTLKAGLANKIVAQLATKICISWEESGQYFPREKTVLTGNPLRQEFFSKAKLRKQGMTKGELPTLYITGGSAGSHAINTLIEGCIEQLLEKFQVIHQTGDAKEYDDFARLQEKKESLTKKLQERYRLVKFVDPGEVAGVLAEADIVVCRSGMNTVTELLYLGKPCLLIPLPHGQTNEQLDNAKLVEQVGLGVIAEQGTLTAEKLYGQILAILDKINTYEDSAQKAKRLIHEDAAEKIVAILKSAGRQKNS